MSLKVLYIHGLESGPKGAKARCIAERFQLQSVHMDCSPLKPYLRGRWQINGAGILALKQPLVQSTLCLCGFMLWFLLRAQFRLLAICAAFVSWVIVRKKVGEIISRAAQFMAFNHTYAYVHI